MAAGEMVVIDGVRYQEQDAQAKGLLTKDGKPVRNKARKAPAPVTSRSKGGANDNGGDGGSGDTTAAS